MMSIMCKKLYDIGEGKPLTEEEFRGEIASALDDYNEAVGNSNSLLEPDEHDDAETWREYHEAEEEVRACEERLDTLYGIMEDNPPEQEDEATRGLERWWIDRETDPPSEEQIDDAMSRL